MEENTEIETSLLHKKQDELTVGDAIKLQVYAIAAVGAVYGAVVGAAVGYNKFAEWRARKDAEKVLNIVETTCTSEEV